MPLTSFFLCQMNIQNTVAVYAPLALKCKYRGLPPQVVSYTSDSKTRCVILSAYRSLPHFTKLANKVKYPHLFGWPLFLGVKRIFRQNLMHLKESLEPFSCLEFIFEKGKHREAGLKHEHKLEYLRLRIFRDTLILVFVNENFCLCICFTELYFFY